MGVRHRLVATRGSLSGSATRPEYGQEGMQGYLKEFDGNRRGLAEREANERAADDSMRNGAVWPTWENTKFYTYLVRL